MPLGAAKIAYQGYSVVVEEARSSAAVRSVDLGGTSVQSTAGKFSGTSVGSADGGDYITVYPVDTNWDFEYNQPWTIEYWFKTSTSSFTPSSNFTLGGLDYGPTTKVSHRVVSGYNGCRVYLGSTSNYTSFAWSTSWRHFAWVNDGSGTLKFYLDGVLKKTNSSFNNTLTFRHRFFYGSTSGSSGQPTYYWDEMRFSNIARYTNSFTPHTSPHENDGNTLGLFHFDNNYNDDNDL